MRISIDFEIQCIPKKLRPKPLEVKQINCYNFHKMTHTDLCYTISSNGTLEYNKYVSLYVQSQAIGVPEGLPFTESITFEIIWISNDSMPPKEFYKMYLNIATHILEQLEENHNVPSYSIIFQTVK